MLTSNMNQTAEQRRLEQLINRGKSILEMAVVKQSQLGITLNIFDGDGPELFTQWKLSCRKLLKSISEEDYISFVDAERHRGMEPAPIVLKRLMSILKASLDDLNHQITDRKLTNVEHTKITGDTINYYGLINNGNMANHNKNSDIDLTSNVFNGLKGDFESLSSKFKSYGIDETDIQELRSIIDITPEPQSSSEYSEELKSWIKKMMVKSIDGSWQVAIGAAGSILGSGIQNYFGILS